MALDLLNRLREKNILGEYGAFTRPFVILDINEYREILAALESKPKRGRPKVPSEAVRV